MVRHPSAIFAGKMRVYAGAIYAVRKARRTGSSKSSQEAASSVLRTTQPASTNLRFFLGKDNRRYSIPGEKNTKKKKQNTKKEKKRRRKRTKRRKKQAIRRRLTLMLTSQKVIRRTNVLVLLIGVLLLMHAQEGSQVTCRYATRRVVETVFVQRFLCG